MKPVRILLALVLADFVGVTAYAVWQYGLAGFFELATANAVTLAISADLVIALSLAAVWMFRDARARGVSPVPYLLLTLGLGSIGPLAYLLQRTGDESAPAIAVTAPRAA